MLKVDSKERITMDRIKSHPWITKGYSSTLNNYILPRSPLTSPLDIRVLRNMKGFGFGTPEEINNIIEQSISLGAVKETEKNNKIFNINIILKKGKKSNSMGSRSGSIKSINRSFSNSSVLSNSFSTDDEEQFKKHVLPIINIYYLVAEKLERIEKYKKSMEMQNQTAALHHANQLNNYKNRDIKLSAEALLQEGMNNKMMMTAVSNIKETDTPTIPANNNPNNNNTTVVTSVINGRRRPSPVTAIKVMDSAPPSVIDIEHRNENIKFEIHNSSSEDSLNHYTEHIGKTLESKEDEFIKMDSEVVLDSNIVFDSTVTPRSSARKLDYSYGSPAHRSYSYSRSHSRSPSPSPRVSPRISPRISPSVSPRLSPNLSPAHNSRSYHRSHSPSLSPAQNSRSHSRSHSRSQSRTRTHSPSPKHNSRSASPLSHYSNSETAIINSTHTGEVIELKAHSSKETLHGQSNPNSPMMSSRKSYSSQSPIKSINSAANKRKSSSNYSSVSKSFKSDQNTNSLTMIPNSSNSSTKEEVIPKDKESEKRPLKSFIKSKNKLYKTLTGSMGSKSSNSSKKDVSQRKSSSNLESQNQNQNQNQNQGQVQSQVQVQGGKTPVIYAEPESQNINGLVENQIIPVPKIAARPRAISSSAARPPMQQYQDPIDLTMTMTSANPKVKDITRHSMVVQKDENVNDSHHRKSFSNLRRFSYAISKTFTKSNSNPPPLPMDNVNANVNANTNANANANTNVNVNVNNASTNNIKAYQNYYGPKLSNGDLRNNNFNNRQGLYHPVSFEQLKMGHRRQPSQESASDLSLTDMLTTSPFQFKVPLTLGRADQHIKNVNLKGLFSVNNTSTHTPTEIRQTIINTLVKFGLFYVEMPGFFQCEYTPDYTLNSNALFSEDATGSFVSTYSMDTEIFNQEYEKSTAIMNSNNNPNNNPNNVVNSKFSRKFRSKSIANMFTNKLNKANWKKSVNGGSLTTMDGNNNNGNINVNGNSNSNSNNSIITPPLSSFSSMISPPLSSLNSMNSLNTSSSMSGINTINTATNSLSTMNSVNNINSFSGGINNINNSNPGQTFTVTSPDGKKKTVNKSKSMANIKYNRKLDSKLLDSKLLKPGRKLTKSIRRSIGGRLKSKSESVESNMDIDVESAKSLSENDMNDRSSLNTNSNSSTTSNSKLKRLKNKIGISKKDKMTNGTIDSLLNPSSLSQSQSSLSPSAQTAVPSTGSQLLSPPQSLQTFSSHDNSSTNVVINDNDTATTSHHRSSSIHSSSHSIKYPQNALQQEYIDMTKGMNTLSIATGEPSKVSHLKKRSITYCVPPVNNVTTFTKVSSDGIHQPILHSKIAAVNLVNQNSTTNTSTTTTPNSRVLHIPDSEIFEDYSPNDNISATMSLTDPPPSVITIEPPTPIISVPTTPHHSKLKNQNSSTTIATVGTNNVEDDNVTVVDGNTIVSSTALPPTLFSGTSNSYVNGNVSGISGDSNSNSNNDNNNGNSNTNGSGDSGKGNTGVTAINTHLSVKPSKQVSPTNSNYYLKKLSPTSTSNLNSILKQQQGTNQTIRFEIAIVRIPWLSLHGIQFRRISGHLWKYKKICLAILKELKL